MAKKNNNNQQLTIQFNNQNPKTMAKDLKFQRVKYDPSKKNAYDKVVGNPYQLTANGKKYQAVPEKMVTLPSGNHFIIARKHVNLGGEYNNKAVYVLGYSNLTGKRQNGKTRRSYFVARLIYRGGIPNLALYRYLGYNYNIAKDVFREIPYDFAEYLAKDGNFHPYTRKSMTSAEIVRANIKKNESLERLKTKAYGTKEQRQAYARQNPSRYHKVK